MTESEKQESQLEHAVDLALNSLSGLVQGYAPSVTQIRDAQEAVYALQRVRRRLRKIRLKMGNAVTHCMVCGNDGLGCSC